jgi:hypothetical protein
MSTMDPIHVMLQQEKGSYAFPCDCPTVGGFYHPQVCGKAVGPNRLNVKWRERICQWSYNVVDQ